MVETVGDGLGDTVSAGVGVGLGVGVGQGGTISAQVCSSGVVPPISLRSSLHFSRQRTTSGGPGFSAVPGKMR